MWTGALVHVSHQDEVIQVKMLLHVQGTKTSSLAQNTASGNLIVSSTEGTSCNARLRNADVTDYVIGSNAASSSTPGDASREAGHSGNSPKNPKNHKKFVKKESEHVTDTFDLPHTAPPRLTEPGPDATIALKMDFLQQQLDSLGVQNPFLDVLVPLGRSANQRLQGGALHTFTLWYPQSQQSPNVWF